VRSEALYRLLDRINRVLLARADRVVAVGEAMRARLIAVKGADPGKVAVIHNWADCRAIVPGPKDNPVSVRLGLADPFVVMHSGNVGLSQGLEVLLDAAERLRCHPDIVFAIVGDGVRRAALEAEARARRLANVRFLPYQPRESLASSFAAADVFVVSLKAGLSGSIVPSKLYGILAAGRPYVAAVEDTTEVAAITRRWRAGRLVPPGDAEQLAAEILTLYRDRDLARSLGENARRAALSFDRPDQVSAYERLFVEIAAAPRPLAQRPARLKRAFDVALAGLGLIVSSPLWVVIALLVKAEDGGPVFYGQERVGKGGRLFRSWKFRSMVAGADRHLDALQARERDPRVTRVGRVLRATAMDELPQLWNILVGDMSFVGPRALVPQEIEVRGDGRPVALDQIPGYELRHHVAPGLTGVAQVYAARDIPRRHKFKLDLLYIRRRSFWLDVKLIALSFWITFRARWEHRGRKV
jgi:lipopolysaccharide/colanic/teichoic acid biosynthesis glycosyltransferase